MLRVALGHGQPRAGDRDGLAAAIRCSVAAALAHGHGDLVAASATLGIAADLDRDAANRDAASDTRKKARVAPSTSMTPLGEEVLVAYSGLYCILE